MEEVSCEGSGAPASVSVAEVLDSKLSVGTGSSDATGPTVALGAGVLVGADVAVGAIEDSPGEDPVPEVLLSSVSVSEVAGAVVSTSGVVEGTVVAAPVDPLLVFAEDVIKVVGDVTVVSVIGCRECVVNIVFTLVVMPTAVVAGPTVVGESPGSMCVYSGTSAINPDVGNVACAPIPSSDSLESSGVLECSVESSSSTGDASIMAFTAVGVGPTVLDELAGASVVLIGC